MGSRLGGAALPGRAGAALIAPVSPVLAACMTPTTPSGGWMPAAPVRTKTNRAGVRRSIRNENRRRTFVRIRKALAFAQRFDPQRRVEQGVKRTLQMLGWPFRENEAIAEGLTARFTLEHKFLVFEVLPPSSYVPNTDVLLPEAQERIDSIEAAGWKCIAVNQRAFERRMLQEHRAHFARRDLVLELVARQAPFEVRAPAWEEIGFDKIRAKRGTIHTKKRMKGKDP